MKIAKPFGFYLYGIAKLVFAFWQLALGSSLQAIKAVAKCSKAQMTKNHKALKREFLNALYYISFCKKVHVSSFVNGMNRKTKDFDPNVSFRIPHVLQTSK